MNREIKFRGLNTKGQWVYGSLISNCTGLEHMPKQNTKTWIVTSAFGHGGWFNVRGREYVLPETVGQLTPIVDDEGIQIYEGDIIFKNDDYAGFDEGVVTFTKCGRWIVVATNGDYEDLCDFNPVIIGNIHQK